METWKSLTGYSLYEYSNEGRLRSLNYKRTGKIKVLKPAKSTDGYLKTMLKDDSGKYKTIGVHRVILNSIIQKPKGTEVNHKNGIKTDNRPGNLEWITHSQNCKHSFDIGLQKAKRGDLNGMSKLTKSDVEFIRNEKLTKGRFWGRNEIAKRLGVTSKHLQDVANNPESWK